MNIMVLLNNKMFITYIVDSRHWTKPAGEKTLKYTSFKNNDQISIRVGVHHWFSATVILYGKLHGLGWLHSE
jgi:hypothetical protein